MSSFCRVYISKYSVNRPKLRNLKNVLIVEYAPDLSNFAARNLPKLKRSTRQ